MNSKNKYHFMLDVEGLSTEHDLLICTIGCCQFDIRTGDIVEEFYKKIDWEPEDGHISKSTLSWWFSPDRDPRARAELCSSEDAIAMNVALIELSEFFTRNIPADEIKNCYVWTTNNFDTARLEHRICEFNKQFPDLIKISIPWYFRNIRDIRTFVDTAKLIDPLFNKEEIYKTYPQYIPHHALHDCILQSKIVSEAYNIIVRQ